MITYELTVRIKPGSLNKLSSRARSRDLKMATGHARHPLLSVQKWAALAKASSISDLWWVDRVTVIKVKRDTLKVFEGCHDKKCKEHMPPKIKKGS